MAAFASIRPPGPARTWLVLAALATLWLPVFGVWIDSNNLAGSSLLPLLSDAPYLGALRRSLTLLAWLVGIGMGIGWPAGVWLGLHQFRGRQLFLGSLCLPLLLPPFLVSIALSFLRPWLPYAWQDVVDGLPGCILTGCQLVLPMAVASAMWIASQLTDGERAAALFAGGPWTLFRYSCRRASMHVLAATTLAALRVLSDPGPSQIMGYHGVASEVMIAFASRYDPVQAGQKALTFSLPLVPLLIPMVWILASNLSNGLARQESGSSNALPRRTRARASGCITLATTLAFLLFAPVIAGLARPLLVPAISGVLAQAIRTLSESAAVTLFHAAVAGATAAGVGWVLASWAGRSRSHRSIVLSSALLLLSLPTSLHALGVLSITHDLPAFLDPILRGRWRVGCTLGLALSPIPTLACLWARAGLSPRQEEQAALHRIGSARFAWRVLVPQVLPALVASALAVAILAVAEVSSTLLLQSPGETTFPGRLFSMMDNASERLVASLAAVYLGTALLGVLGVLVDGLIVCALGDIPGFSSADVIITVAPNAPGSYTNSASVVAVQPDPNTFNNSAAASGSAAVPALSIADVLVTETDNASGVATFDLTLTGFSSQPIWVRYATANGTALGGSDFIATNGLVLFAPGTTTQQVRIPLVGDLINEGVETFLLNLANPTNVTLALTRATAIVLDNDPQPEILISDASFPERDSGNSNATFRIALSAPSSRAVSVNFATINGTALSGSDYTARSGTVTWPAGTTDQAITVPILGDTIPEPNESFILVLSRPIDGVLNQVTALGIILNDDLQDLILIRSVAIDADADACVITFQSVPGRNYRLERAVTFGPSTTWTPVESATSLPGTGEFITVIDPGATTLPERYYRLVLIP